MSGAAGVRWRSWGQAIVIAVSGLVVLAALHLALVGVVFALGTLQFAALGKDAVLGVVWRAVPALVGWMAIIVAVDLGLGYAYDQTFNKEPPEPASTEDLVHTDLPPSDDPRLDTPAMEGLSWAPRYFSELEALKYTYEPYVGARVLTVHGEYINSENGIRRSYRPEPEPGVEPLEVWFFGGSTTWGEGQRDLYTVPSQVVRLAEEHGIAIHAVNFGERGYTAFQELLQFQERLDELGPPDLAVFFDGHNEYGSQDEDPGPPDQPTMYQLPSLELAFDREPSLPWVGNTALPEPTPREDYEDKSLLHQLLRGLGALATISPAAAQEEVTPQDIAEIPEDESGPLEVYARTVALIERLGADHDVPLELFWQPFPQGGQHPDANHALLPDGVHDIERSTLDGPPDEEIFIDGGHTNEEGARLGAEAMWPFLQPTLERLAAG